MSRERIELIRGAAEVLFAPFVLTQSTDPATEPSAEQVRLCAGQVWRHPKQDRFIRVVRPDCGGGFVLVILCDVDGSPRPRLAVKRNGKRSVSPEVHRQMNRADLAGWNLVSPTVGGGQA